MEQKEFVYLLVAQQLSLILLRELVQTRVLLIIMEIPLLEYVILIVYIILIILPMIQTTCVFQVVHLLFMHKT